MNCRNSCSWSNLEAACLVDELSIAGIQEEGGVSLDALRAEIAHLENELSKTREEVGQRQASYMRREKQMQSTLYGLRLEVDKLKNEHVKKPSLADGQKGDSGEEDFIE